MCVCVSRACVLISVCTPGTPTWSSKSVRDITDKQLRDMFTLPAGEEDIYLKDYEEGRLPQKWINMGEEEARMIHSSMVKRNDLPPYKSWPQPLDYNNRSGDLEPGVGM